MQNQQYTLSELVKLFSVKRKVFVSYHHRCDQVWYDRFSSVFASGYELLYDNSLQRKVDSESTSYVDRHIREENIRGTSITIVLCGADTWKRKYVDWEIYATLHHKHALLGIQLPTTPTLANGDIIVPERFATNWRTGYAYLVGWTEDPLQLKSAIEIAVMKSQLKAAINNSMHKMQRNLA